MRTQALLDRLIPEAELRVIARCTAFVCTVGSIERAKDAKLANKRIQTAIVDESSLLPEFAVPRLLTKRGIDNAPVPWIRNLVLIGDHKQLPSFSHGPTNVDNGSLMQRIAEVTGCHLLEEQYRMDPAICGLVSELFYGGRLYTNANIAIERRKARQRGPDGLAQPVRLHDIEGEERHPQQCGGEKSTSWLNEQEANAIVQWYKHRRDKGSREHRTRNRKQTVLIICQYKAQAKLLKQLLPADTEHHNFKLHGSFKDKNLKIVTVDSAQGSEAEIVALSCVRANFNGDIGHAKNMKRACVALSRARGELHIFANRKTMGSQRNRMWREVFELVENPTDRSLCKDPYEQRKYLGLSYDDVEDVDWPELPSLGPRQLEVGMLDDDGLAAAC
jgi:superfamily I DNA and/or RNA helicase